MWTEFVFRSISCTCSEILERVCNHLGSGWRTLDMFIIEKLAYYLFNNKMQIADTRFCVCPLV